MGTRRTLLEYASDVVQLCPGEKTAQELYDDLCTVKSFVSLKEMNLDLRCTHSEVNNCYIIDDLVPWNECLCILNLELKETVPGKLGVLPLHHRPLPETSHSKSYLAYTLLHWLLQEHRCIMALELKGEAISWRHKLLFDAMGRCSGLRKLRVTCCNADNTAGCADDLVTTIGALEKLEKLELETLILSLPAQKKLVHNFGHLHSLKSLVLLGVDALDDDKPTDENPSASFLFGEYLANNTSLKKLAIGLGPYQVPQLEAVLQALRESKSLMKLSFEYVKLGTEQLELLSEAVAENTTLRILHFTWFSSSFELKTLAKLIERNAGLHELQVGSIKIKDIVPLAHAIRANRTLKKLGFFWQYMNTKNAVTFYEALASNSSLECVSIGEVCDGKLAKFYKTLVVSGIKEKIKFSTVITDPSLLLQVLHRWFDLAEIVYENSYENEVSPSLCYGIQMMASSSQLLQLTICIEAPLTKELANSLVILLSTTRTLERVHLEFGQSKPYTHIVLDKGLSLNKTITWLSLVNWQFTELDAAVLGLVLKENVTLNGLLIACDKASSAALVAELGKCIHVNHHLLDFVVKKRSTPEPQVYKQFEIDHVIRRNMSHVHRAVQFVLGRDGQCFAEAFEMLCRSEVLVERVKKAGSLAECEAREKIAERLNHLKMDFMVAVGIVRKSVGCDRPDRGGVQLDQIGIDNWLCIRSYLKAADIKKRSAADQ
ncbi:unnamed protein product [Ixodes persulcatus]